MFLTTLMRTFQILGAGLPRVVKLRIDGGSEGWNQCTLAFVDLCFDLFPQLEEFYVSRFAVGHTHADLDRFFSYINQILFSTAAGGKKAGMDIPTRERFRELVLEALKNKKDTQLLEHHMEDLLFAFDFWALLRPHLNSEFKNYGATGPVHVFRFKRQIGRATPHISYKYWSQDAKWLPADGSSLKVLNTRPDLRTAEMKVAPIARRQWPIYPHCKINCWIILWTDSGWGLSMTIRRLTMSKCGGPFSTLFLQHLRDPLHLNFPGSARSLTPPPRPPPHPFPPCRRPAQIGCPRCSPCRSAH